MNAFDPRIILITTYMPSLEGSFRSQILSEAPQLCEAKAQWLPTLPCNRPEKIQVEDRVRIAFSPMLM